MKILERNENQYILEPLKQYLENEGIKAEIQIEWKSVKASGPYVLVVEDDLYVDAIRVLDNIDKWEIDDGVPLTTKSGKTVAQMKEQRDRYARWMARAILAMVVLGVVYLIIRY